MKFSKILVLWISMTGLYAIALESSINNNSILEWNEIANAIVIMLLYLITFVTANIISDKE